MDSRSLSFFICSTVFLNSFISSCTDSISVFIWPILMWMDLSSVTSSFSPLTSFLVWFILSWRFVQSSFISFKFMLTELSSLWIEFISSFISLSIWALSPSTSLFVPFASLSIRFFNSSTSLFIPFVSLSTCFFNPSTSLFTPFTSSLRREWSLFILSNWVSKEPNTSRDT